MNRSRKDVTVCIKNIVIPCGPQTASRSTVFFLPREISSPTPQFDSSWSACLSLMVINNKRKKSGDIDISTTLAPALRDAINIKITLTPRINFYQPCGKMWPRGKYNSKPTYGTFVRSLLPTKDSFGEKRMCIIGKYSNDNLNAGNLILSVYLYFF